ncbi:zincin-like metallopeptidase toxin domain-containing protein [Flavobacterium sp. SUN052]|uniref:zincin-like metallopeptidase toxin domain-containing protein n=1 Tax=Flavobacterium sp. SUN052 TaxID=3002441 RepID=UPI00237ECACC|nr:zincin-like metallopeptidase toxin domain-containing protein [Flavobacterium sp. SUN052]MEC4004914.1 zincin-like metallopeptidase toxin domain-containing protein [Flavobacterium sp. SUN052]
MVEDSKKVVDEVDFLVKTSETGKYGGKKLTASQIRQYKGELKQNGVEVFFEKDLKLNSFDRIKNKAAVKKFIPFTVDGIKFETIQDFYFFMRQDGYLGAFHAETNQLFLTENPTRYLAFHEKTHVKHFLEVGSQYHNLPSWEKETYVFKEIWINKHQWTQIELSHALVMFQS